MRDNRFEEGKKSQAARAKFFFTALILMVFGIFPLKSSGQIDIEGYLVKETITCHEIALKSTSLIPLLHQANQLDTLYTLLYYWDEQCGLAEPLLRFYLLHQIETNTFSDDFYPDEILTYLNHYQETTRFEDPNYYLDYYTWEYYPIDTTYNVFTSNLALHLQRFADLKPIESFFLDYYSNRFSQAMDRLKKGELTGTRLDSIYQVQQLAIKQAKKSYLNLYGGLWSPRGELKLLGSHPQIGFGAGFIQNRFMLEFIMKIGFLSSPNYYEVVVDNEGYQTKNFTNLHVSGRIGLALVDYMRHQIILSLGLGYEGIEAFTSAEQEDYGLSRMISSFSFSPGAELRVPAGEHSYIGFSVRYNFLNFQTRKDETPLPGDALLIGMSVGFNLD
ncbi:MAG: hypothetical protein V2I46_03525 [Bacteroides sp.]|jgi:hypothetical protein|nr:hypothetical protein [Bacteroides sp.]